MLCMTTVRRTGGMQSMPYVDWTGRQIGSQRQFAIDIGCHAELANHLHLILCTRPDVVATYGDEDVLRRGWIVARLK